jgi:hypothetical protein
MADLSKLSTEDLLALKAKISGSSVAGMSNEALIDARNHALAQQRIESERGPLQEVDDRVRSFARGVPALGGSMDEAAAFMNTGAGLLSDYDKELAYQRQRDVDYDARHPVQSAIGQVGGVVAGTLAGARFLPKGAMPKSMIGKVAAGIGTGAGLGGVETFTRGEGGFNQRMDAVPAGAAIGGAFGMAAPILGKAIGAGVNAVTHKYGPYATIQQMRDATRELYKKAEDAGLVFSPESYAKTIDDISADGREMGIGGPLSDVTDDLHGRAVKLMNKLENTKGAAPSLADVEEAKRVAAAIGGRDDAEGAAGKMIAAKLHKLVDNATADDFVAGNVEEGLQNIQAGKQSYARTQRARMFNQAVHEAKNSAGDFSTALKTKLRTIANSDDFQYWPPEEQAALLNAMRSTPGEKIMRGVGKFGYGGTFGNMFSGSTSALAPYVGVPLSLLTTAARHGAKRVGVNNARIAEALIKTGEVPKPTRSAIAAQKIAEALMYGGSGQAGSHLAPRASYAGR